MTSLKVASLNVRSLKGLTRRTALFVYLKTLDFDICFLQECGIDTGLDYNYLKNDWKWGPSVWSGSNDNKSTGVGLLCRALIFWFNQQRKFYLEEPCWSI